MRVSYSRVGTFKQCPYKFKLRYVDGIETLPNVDDPANPLLIGSALHKGIEANADTAIEEYNASFPVVNDMNVIEEIKLRHVIEQCREMLPDGMHEVKIEKENEFVGYIDLLVPVGENVFDLYDFKYSNAIDRYMESEQLHVYKYYFEKLNPTKTIRNLYFLFVPKVSIRKKWKNKTNKRDETIEEFQKRVRETLARSEPILMEVPYDSEKVKAFLRNAKECKEATTFPKAPSRLCDWCEYQKYCEEGETYMLLPKNERTKREDSVKRKIWVYGAPFSGKTHLANEFPDVLLLSTDGNYTQLPKGIPPHIDIKDIVTVEGRITKRKLAWDLFKDVIEELEKKQNDFKTIALDLVEDTYEMCRLYMYDKLGITHESDDSFRAWDKVRTEYLSTMRRFFNLPYENIIILSHEDTSKDITRKSGDKVTQIKPNINDKCANKLSGMVDIVVRATKDEKENYTLSFKTNEVIFGGGRLAMQADEIENSYDALIRVYDDANKAYEQMAGEVKPASKPKTETADEKPEKKLETPETPTEEAVKPLKRKPRKPKEFTESEIDKAIEEGDFATLAEVSKASKEKALESQNAENVSNDAENTENKELNNMDVNNEPETPKRRRRKKTA